MINSNKTYQWTNISILWASWSHIFHIFFEHWMWIISHLYYCSNFTLVHWITFTELKMYLKMEHIGGWVVKKLIGYSPTFDLLCKPLPSLPPLHPNIFGLLSGLQKDPLSPPYLLCPLEVDLLSPSKGDIFNTPHLIF